MSHPAPNGRGSPRWSTTVAASQIPAVPGGMAFTPTDPATGTRVNVSPPLFPNGPSACTVLGRSPGPVSAHVASSAMLYPPELVTPLQLGPLLSNTEPVIRSVPSNRSTF